MEKGDILTVVGGLVIVLVIALIVNPHYIAGLRPSAPFATPVSTQSTTVQITGTATSVKQITSQVPATTRQMAPSPPSLYRIYYTDKPFSYPEVMLPENLDVYGQSDILRPTEDFVTFAQLDEQRGGLTRVFTIPYPLWAMNITVFDNSTPNAGSFRMALCYASNGTVIEGIEMIHPGISFKRIRTSNTPLYLIISTTGIDGFRIDFQTTRDYYTLVNPMATVS